MNTVYTEGLGNRQLTKWYDVDSLMGELVNYDLSPDYVSEGFSDTVSETFQISVKSIKTLHIAIPPLKDFLRNRISPQPLRRFLKSSESQYGHWEFHPLRLPRAKALTMTGKGDVPDFLPDEVVETFSTAAQISVKSYPALFRALSLLKLAGGVRG